MTLFNRDQFAREGDDAGIFIEGLGAALMTWAAMQNRSNVTVHEACTAFNTTPAIIREALEEAMWIYIVGPDDDPKQQRLELDGE